MIPKPPKLNELPANTELIAGLGKSTILADFDFETYSEAGFIWDARLNKHRLPLNSKKRGLEAVGVANYAEHPSTEVLSLAYDLKDGRGSRLWVPGMPAPLDLFEYITRGGLIEAWNIAFERWIWANVCVRKYGWIELPLEQTRCAMAKARAYALPGSLSACGNVMQIQNQKDKDGKRLLNKFSIPRNPTKSNPKRRILPQDDIEDAQRLYQYNIKDIEAEAEISSLVPSLTGWELEFWLCDQRINARGVQLDSSTIINALSLIEQAYRKYNDQIPRLTNGYAKSASEVAKISSWITSRGIPVPNLDAETVQRLLRSDTLPDDVRQVLKIRDMLSLASIKKLYAMINQITSKGRVHDLFIYHSARTGRAAGAGTQPQNLPNSGPVVTKCGVCNHYYGEKIQTCFWCGASSTADYVEWNAQAAEDAIETINSGVPLCQVEDRWGDTVELISSCLRSLFVAAPGHDLICSDYSAIEAVVLAALAGEQWRMDVFKTHGKIYEMSASKITGIPLEHYLEFKKVNNKHHPDRKIGKVAELACFTHNTQVLTHRGYVPIMDVTLSDQLWDGIKWVSHAGIINKGKRKIIKLDGIEVTPNHPINFGHSWQAAKLLASNENMLTRALAIGSENLPILVSLDDQKKATVWQNANVHAVNLLARLIAILGLEDRDGVITALRKQVKLHSLNGLKHTKSTDILYRILNIDEDWEIVYRQLLVVAIDLKTHHTPIMAAVVLKFMKLGAVKSMNFLHILLRSRAGIMKCLKWIELIAQEIMSLEISDSLLGQIMLQINEKFQNFKKELKNLKTVYDIVNAGDLNRFTIKTNSGHLIVHNSGYGGWIGAWKAFKADEFLLEDQIKQSILAWRAASPMIVEFWGGQMKHWYPEFYGLEGAAIQAVQFPGTEFSYREITYIRRGNVLYCRLPSGRYLTYHNPILQPSSRKQDTLSLSFEGWNTNPKYGAPGWIRIETYGGKLTENVVQAVSRDILAHAIIQLEKAGYPVVLHVHDEIVAEVPEGFGSVQEFERIMSSLPDWAKDWPVKASGGWRAKRYSK